MIVGTSWMIAISVAVNLGSVAVIVGRSPPARCNHCGHSPSFIAIRAADDCGSLHIAGLGLVSDIAAEVSATAGTIRTEAEAPSMNFAAAASWRTHAHTAVCETPLTSKAFRL